MENKGHEIRKLLKSYPHNDSFKNEEKKTNQSIYNEIFKMAFDNLINM